MTDTPKIDTEMTKFIEDIAKQCWERGYAYAIVVSGSTQTESRTEPFPGWSCFARVDTEHGPGVVVKPDPEKDPDNLTASLNSMVTTRDAAAHSLSLMDSFKDAVVKVLAAHGIETGRPPATVDAEIPGEVMN